MIQPISGFYKPCAFCGKDFYTIPSHSSQKYCSRTCMADAYRKVNGAPTRPPTGSYKTCPTCGKEFYVIPAILSTRTYCRNVCAVTYRRTHGLPEKTCPVCGKQFKPEKSKVIHCSPECAYIGSFEATTTKRCEQCGNSFEVTPCHKDRKFCSEKCHHKSMTNRIVKMCKECGNPFEVIPAKQKQQYCSQACREKKIEKICAYCGKDFYVTRSGDFRKTCSRSCLAYLRVQNGTSPVQDKEVKKRAREASRKYYEEDPARHPFYVDGSYSGGRRYRGPNWTQQKNAARERDHYTCQRCGRHESEFSKKLSVHHIIPYNDFASSFEANKLDNLICYCQSCHKTLENLENAEKRRKSTG